MYDLQIYSRHKRYSFFFNLKALKSTISKTFAREKEIPISQLCSCITFKVVSLRSDVKDGPKNLSSTSKVTCGFGNWNVFEFKT